MIAALIAALTLLAAAPVRQAALPAGFVYLRDVAPTIQQDMRYAGYHNFIGRPIDGYLAGECILTRQAALALARVQAELEPSDLTLKVYDCYRPQRAVDEFIAWSHVASDQTMKDEFYPRVDKTRLFALGYIARKSGHTRGSTVDLTIARTTARAHEPYRPGDPLHSCIGTFIERFHDGTMDMGTEFDCMDVLSHPDADVGQIAAAHRELLHDLMIKYGFKGITEEWWHFTLANEPFPKTYFNFPIVAK